MAQSGEAENPLHQEVMDRAQADPPADQLPPEAVNINDAHLLALRLIAEHQRMLDGANAWQAAIQQNVMGGGFAFVPPMLDRAGRENNGQVGPLRPNMDFHGAAAGVAAEAAAGAHDQQNAFNNDGGNHLAANNGANGNGGEAANVEPAPAVAVAANPFQENNQWTYEEQFKQLYEMGDEPDRREFLDSLFQFMQRRGSPINRIPIMAKQTLDIYRLFKLVVAKGGLVEVINKKLWRDITQGLSLPSSITSAAFTLRSQYMKYLYEYECERYGFSTKMELNIAIDGNKREGRRPGLSSSDSSNIANPHGIGMQPMSLARAHALANYLMLQNPMMSGRGQVPMAANPAQTPVNGGNMHALLLGNGLTANGFAEAVRANGAAQNLPVTSAFKPPMETPYHPPNLKRSRDADCPSSPNRRLRQYAERRDERSSSESDQPENSVVSVQPASRSYGANETSASEDSNASDSSSGVNGRNEPFRVSMKIEGKIYEGLLYPQSADEKKDNEKDDNM